MGACGLTPRTRHIQPCVPQSGRCATLVMFHPDRLQDQDGLCSILCLPRPANAAPGGVSHYILSICRYEAPAGVRHDQNTNTR